MAPWLAVAIEAGKLTAPRKVLAPFTSSGVAGVVVAMPMLVPDSGPANVCRVVCVEEMPPRFASASAGSAAPVPPFAVETGPERANVTFPLEPPPVRPGPVVMPVMVPAPTPGKV